MKFEKGMNQMLLWDFLHFNIFDYFDNSDSSLFEWKELSWFEKYIFGKTGRLKKDIEIIVKINGKVMPDCWEN